MLSGHEVRLKPAKAAEPLHDAKMEKCVEEARNEAVLRRKRA